MSVIATVQYNDEHERTSISVDAKQVIGVTARFKMDSNTAVLTSVKQREGGADVYGDAISYVMDYVENLPFVQAVTIEEYEPPEGAEL